MAKNNPWESIDKLRQEVGADQVIPAGSFTQSEPATSYKVGSSIMSVDMTITDWPNPGIGTVTTSRSDADNAVQYFQPKGSTSTWTRSWDDTTPNLSDNFDAATLDESKWTLNTPLNHQSVTAYIYNNSWLRIQSDTGVKGTGSVQGSYYLSGDFDIQVNKAQHSQSAMGVFFVGDYPTHLDHDLWNVAANGYDWANVTGLGQIGDFQVAYVNGVKNYEQSGVYSTAPIYYRITRISSTMRVYRRFNELDAWTQLGSGTHSINDMFVSLYGGSANTTNTGTVSFDNYKINSGTATLISGGTSIWQPWTEVKSAEDQLVIAQNEATTAVTTHETSYDHTTFVAQTDIDTSVTTHETSYDHTTFITQATAINPDQKAVANGVATLDGNIKVPTAQLPALAITDVSSVADIAARDALTPLEGDVSIVTDTGGGEPDTFIYDGSAWVTLAKPSGAGVDSVNGNIGVVTLTATDVGAEPSGAVSTHAALDIHIPTDAGVIYPYAVDPFSILTDPTVNNLAYDELAGAGSSYITNKTYRCNIGEFRILNVIGDKIRITVECYSTSDECLDDLYIGKPGTNPWEFDGNQVKVTWNNGDATLIQSKQFGSIPTAMTHFISDWIDVSHWTGGGIDGSENLVVSMFSTNLTQAGFGADSFVNRYLSDAGTGVNEAAATAPLMTTTGLNWSLVVGVEIGSGPLIANVSIGKVNDMILAKDSNTYYVKATEPNVWNNVTPGTTRVRAVYVDDTGGNTEYNTTTTFTSIDDVDVFYNGIRLLAGNEFIDSVGNPGTHITLTDATIVGDDVEIIVWKA